jgi:glycosyltransferase involved in cell wall biosynthesis/predicted metal-dependent phosphoesterase TrpH
VARCDLHVHSIYSTDSGNYALRRARLGESFTRPGRVYDSCVARGMDMVTISDHNTLAGALDIADRPGAFLSVEVTTRFPEDDTPLHVLVWNLSEEDHRDLQPLRGSVYELVGLLKERELVHALAHPLYRMGAALTAWHVERMMLLFAVWEGQNGARPRSSNDLASRLAAAVGPEYLIKLADRHGLEPVHDGRIRLSGGSDDHGGLDIATTWTEAPGSDPVAFLDAVASGAGAPGGEHGSTVKLAHAVGSLALNAYRSDGRELPGFLAQTIAPLFDGGGEVAGRHEEITRAASAIARLLGERARQGGLGLDALPTAGARVGALLLAGAVELPYLASMRHHGGTRSDVEPLAAAFFGPSPRAQEPRAIVFTDTFSETNGVAGTMRRLAAAAAAGEIALSVATADPAAREGPGIIRLEADWSLPLPAYERLSLNFPLLTQVLAQVERKEPDLIHVATPGPIGLCGLVAAKLLGLPLVGSYHTELGPYAMHLTRDAVVADAFDLYVAWFYRQCDRVLAPTRAVAERLEARGLGVGVGIWGRGVDTAVFAPDRRSQTLRASLLEPGELLLLSVGRLSDEKRLDILLDAVALLPAETSIRVVVAGDGPARPRLEARASDRVRFVGERHGEDLARLYASADLFCFPSTTDTFGQVLLEAGSSGLPVVAARAGGAPELVAEGSSGLLVPPDDPAALAAAIRTLAASPELRARYGARARAIAAGRSWSRSLEELRAAYVAATEASAPTEVEPMPLASARPA